MIQPRLRIFAGPNGSGKSTLFESFSKKYAAGYFLNADNIENELTKKGFIDLSDYQLNLDQTDLESFYALPHAKTLIEKAIKDKHMIDIAIKENVIVDRTRVTHSYEGALISMFLRHHLMCKHEDFCFETVMSHSSKVSEIREAKAAGYKTYLYFVCTDDPTVNISRVENRVEKGGHNVSNDKIASRYNESLNNLIGAIDACHKTYLFDNSRESNRLIAKVILGELTLTVEPEELPNWFIEKVLPFYSN